MDVDITKLDKSSGQVWTEQNADTIDDNFINIRNTLKDVNIPNRTSQLLNDSNYITSPELTPKALETIQTFNENFNNIGGGVGSLSDKINNLQQQNAELLNLLDLILNGQIIATEGQAITNENGNEITL